MGTWEVGPFENDAAMDYLADVVDGLRETIQTFVNEPQIDETFEPAFAAVALLNILTEHTSAHPGEPGDLRGWREVFLRCYDEQIDGLDPVPGFKVKGREALVRELDRLVAVADRQAGEDGDGKEDV